MGKLLTEKNWQPKNIPSLFIVNGELYKNKEALTYKKGHRYHKLTYGELRDEIMRAVFVFGKLGLKKNDYALIVSENRPEWVIADIALMILGVRTVPLSKNLSSAQVACILEETKPVVAFLSDEKAWATVEAGQSSVKTINRLVSFERLPQNLTPKTNLKVDSFEDLMKEASVVSDDKLLEEGKVLAQAVSPDEVATVVYTSGTTGKPKGAKIRHCNLIFVITRVREWFEIESDDVFLSVMPLSHILERLAGNFLPFYAGSSVEYCIDIANFLTDLKRVRPTIILAAPRLFERVYNQECNKTSEKLAAKILAKLERWPKRAASGLTKILNWILSQRLRANLGRRTKFWVTGGAAINPEIILFFNKRGVALVEGYGLTEAASSVTNRVLDNRPSTVGKPLTELEIKIAHDGEVLIKGGSVITGYLNPLDDEGMFTEDGFLKTGDLGEIDQDGYLSLTGRKKDIQVLTTGEKIAPAVVENILTSVPYIEQALVVGDGYKHIAAIVVLNGSAVANRLKIADKTGLAKQQRVIDFLSEEIAKATRDLPKNQQVRKFILTDVPFSVENEQATSSLKPRRPIILDYYADEIKKLYR